MLDAEVCVKTVSTNVSLFLFQANSTFEFFARIKAAAQDWIKVSPHITKYLSDSAEIKQAKVSYTIMMSFRM